MFKRHWRAIAGLLSATYGVVRAVLDSIGYIDLFVAHENATAKTWLGHTIDFLLAPPEWMVFPILIGGLVLIWWDVRRTHPFHPHSATVTLQGAEASTTTGDITAKVAPTTSTKERSSPLEVFFDPTNWRFGRSARRDDEPGCDYFVEVSNEGGRTLENVAVTYSYYNEKDHHASEGPNGISLDPGQRVFVKLFFRAYEEYVDVGELGDPSPFKVRVRATARDTLPSADTTLDFNPSGREVEDDGGPYNVTVLSQESIVL